MDRNWNKEGSNPPGILTELDKSVSDLLLGPRIYHNRRPSTFFYVSGTFAPSNVAVGAREYSRVIRRRLRFPASYMSLDLQQWFLINVQLPRVFDILGGTRTSN